MATAGYRTRSLSKGYRPRTEGYEPEMGRLAPLASYSLSQPAGTRPVTPPALAPGAGGGRWAPLLAGGAPRELGAPLGGAAGGRAGTLTGIASGLASMGMGAGAQVPAVAPSPYEPAYYEDIEAARAVEAARESERTAGLARAQGLAAPGAYLQQGKPASYWQNELQLQQGELRANYRARRAQLEEALRMRQISAARYEMEMEKLGREEQGELTALAQRLRNERMQDDERVAMERAKLALAGAQAVPTERVPMAVPQAIPLTREPSLRETLGGGGVRVLGGGGGVENEIMAGMKAARQQGFEKWQDIPEDLRRVFFPRYKAAEAE